MAGGTWIKVYSNVFSHKKTFMLADRLKINETYAGAHLIRLWTWAIDNTKDGNLTGISCQLIAKAADWLKNADQFVNACISSGFLDQTDDGNLIIHDWDEYTETLVRRRERDADRKRNERQKREEAIGTSDGRPQDVRTPVRRTSARPSAGCPVPKSRVEESRVDISILGKQEGRGSSSIQQVETSASSAASDSNSSLQADPIASILQAYERDIGMPSGTVMDKIRQLIEQDGVSPGLIVLAIAEAAECNKRSFRYVEGILKRCLTDGIRTEERFLAQKVERAAAKARPSTRNEPAASEQSAEDYSHGWNTDPSMIPEFMKPKEGDGL